MALSTDAHRAVQRQAKAPSGTPGQRDRRRRGLTPLVSWERGGWRRCVVCGRWCSESGTAGHGFGWRLCESCFVVRELREEAARLSGATANVDPQRRAA